MKLPPITPSETQADAARSHAAVFQFFRKAAHRAAARPLPTGITPFTLLSIMYDTFSNLSRAFCEKSLIFSSKSKKQRSAQIPAMIFRQEGYASRPQGVCKQPHLADTCQALLWPKDKIPLALGRIDACIYLHIDALLFFRIVRVTAILSSQAENQRSAQIPAIIFRGPL